MQKKRNTRFKAVDLAIIILCLAGSTISAIAFWQVYDRTLTKLNEEPVGTIVFKKRTAQRKFEDRLVWDRLKQSSPLYNGDTIRTIELSEAVITFRDEISHLTIYENTMIKIFYDDKDGIRIDFSAGNMEVNSGLGGIIVTSGASTITVEGQADFNKSESGFNFSVLSGSANFDGEEVESGRILAMDQHGVRSIKPAIAMTSFGSSIRAAGVSGETTPVVFSWNESNFESGTYVIVEVALDRDFTRVVGSRDIGGAVSAVIPVENGNFWWRAYPANSGSREPANDIYPSGPLEVFPVSASRLIAPANSAEIIVYDNTNVSFLWTAVTGAVSYLVEISTSANMSAPAVSRRVEETGITQSGLSAGSWYWRITPIFPDWIIGLPPPSAASDFSLIAGFVPAEPVSPPMETGIAAAPQIQEFEQQPINEEEFVAAALSHETEPERQPEPEIQLEFARQLESAPAAAQTQVSAASLDTVQAAAANQSSAISGWLPNYDPASTSRVTTDRELIDGQEKEVTTITTNLAQGSPRWSGAIFEDEAFNQRLREGVGVRFKVLGDGKSWDFIVETTQTNMGRGPHRRLVSTRNGIVTEYDIPYSQLRQPSWWQGARQTFNKNNIINIIFERNPEHTAGSATIKIFDLEVYTDPVPQAAGNARQGELISIVSANWEPQVHGGNQSVRANTSANLSTGREVIEGQEKDVLILEVTISRGNEWRMGQFLVFDEPAITQSLRAGSGIRFKVLGDGVRGWRILFPTAETLAGDNHYQSLFTTRRGSIVEVDIPYSSLRQPDWALNNQSLRRIAFDKDNIQNMIIQRLAEAHETSVSGHSTIKIFDFEVY